MRKDLGVRAALYPMPVFIIATYDREGKPNAMTAAWGGISEENELTICISADHRTTANILERKSYTVSMATADHVASCDYVGIVSGNDEPDKMEKAGFTTSPARFVNAPVINELPFAVECRLKSWESDRCRLVGEIVNVSVDERVLTDGKVDVAKMRPIAYDSLNHDYRVLGEIVGKAYKDGLKLR